MKLVGSANDLNPANLIELRRTKTLPISVTKISDEAAVRPAEKSLMLPEASRALASFQALNLCIAVKPELLTLKIGSSALFYYGISYHNNSV
jgi:hypothetical protein